MATALLPLIAEVDDVASKLTSAVCLMVIPSSGSVAANAAEPGVEDFTVNVATPESSVTPWTGVMVAPEPDVCASVTGLPEKWRPPASLIVTVIIVVDVQIGRAHV